MSGEMSGELVENGCLRGEMSGVRGMGCSKEWRPRTWVPAEEVWKILQNSPLFRHANLSQQHPQLPGAFLAHSPFTGLKAEFPRDHLDPDLTSVISGRERRHRPRVDRVRGVGDHQATSGSVAGGRRGGPNTYPSVDCWTNPSSEIELRG